MIARRDVIRLMTATAAARHLPFAISPQEAAAKLAEPVPFEIGETVPTESYPGYGTPTSPADFAESMRMSMDADAFGWFNEGAPVEYAKYRQALHAVSDVAPALLPLKGLNALGRLDDAVMNLVMTAWNAGVGVGAELEHVRQAMLRPVQVCHRCHGSGRAEYMSPMLTPDMQPEDPPHICRTCGGSGTLPAAAV